jgi:hypothetical protein
MPFVFPCHWFTAFRISAVSFTLTVNQFAAHVCWLALDVRLAYLSASAVCRQATAAVMLADGCAAAHP